jgi:hypothetical protein
MKTYLFNTKLKVKKRKIISSRKQVWEKFSTAKYERPIEIEITEMERNNIH